MSEKKHKSTPVTAIPWHPGLIALFPILSLLANNVGHIDYSLAYRAINLAVGTSVFVMLGLHLIYKSWHRAAVFTSALMAMVFSYGHVHNYAAGKELFGLVIGGHRYIVILYAVIFAVILWWIRDPGRDYKTATLSLNTFAIALLIFPIYTIAAYESAYARDAADYRKSISGNKLFADLSVSASSPDIYFIVLDQYGRSDVLEKYFDYNNGFLIQALKEMGFYIASCAHSNYMSTSLSLAATLNLEYVTELDDAFEPRDPGYHYLWVTIKDNRVRKTLEDLGYQTIAFQTDFRFTEFADAEYYFKTSSPDVNKFESLLLSNSAAQFLIDQGYIEKESLSEHDRKRDLVFEVFERLASVPSLPGKKFVFVHLLVPHPPFVFGPGGEKLVVDAYLENGEAGYRRDDFRAGYRNQVIFISRQISQLIRAILDASPRPPVIILQGDHGPITIPIAERFGILSAFLLPDAGAELYQTMSPVNNFRVIFNAYFNGAFPLLPDRNLYNSISDPYHYVEYTNPCPR